MREFSENVFFFFCVALAIIALVNCTTEASIRERPPVQNLLAKEDRAANGGLLYVPVGRTLKETGLNHDKVYRKAKELCSPKWVDPEIDEWYDFQDKNTIQKRRVLKFQYSCSGGA